MVENTINPPNNEGLLKLLEKPPGPDNLPEAIHIMGWVEELPNPNIFKVLSHHGYLMGGRVWALTDVPGQHWEIVDNNPKYILDFNFVGPEVPSSEYDNPGTIFFDEDRYWITTLDGVQLFPQHGTGFKGRVYPLDHLVNGPWVLKNNTFPERATFFCLGRFMTVVNASTGECRPFVAEIEPAIQVQTKDGWKNLDSFAPPDEIDKALEQAAPDVWEDKGAIAKDRLAITLKATKKRMWKYRIALWLSWLALLGALGTFGFQYAMENVKYGRYTDERSCKVSKGDFVVTGKRTYSYPYKTLFGFRVTNENDMIVKTVVNVNGSKFSVLGLTDTKYWEVNIGTGEKGIAMLKDANTYIFSSDKVKIVATEGGFCNPVQRTLTDEELKAPEADVIK